jgi:hypothetical protein
MTDTEKFFTILGRTKNLVLHATGDIYVRTNDRFVGRFPDILPARSKYQDEIETLRQNWHSFRPDDATTREPDTEYYLVKFQPTPRADTQIVGCLRFPHGTIHPTFERPSGLTHTRTKRLDLYQRCRATEPGDDHDEGREA